MSSELSGWTLMGLLFAVSLLAHEPWRWVGMFLGRNLDMNGELFGWVKSVSTALVAALVMRLMVFPAGALAGVSLYLRVAAMLVGLAVFLFAGRRISTGVGAAALCLVAGQLLTG
jgi:hypothetical protein